MCRSFCHDRAAVVRQAAHEIVDQRVVERVFEVLRFTGGQRDVPEGQRREARRAAEGLLHAVVLVAVRTVVEVVAVGAQVMRFERRTAGEIPAGVEHARRAAEAVVIRFARGRLHIDAIGRRAGQADAVPAAAAVAAAHAAFDLAAAVVAAADRERRRRTAVGAAAAGEDLHHAADRFRTVEARTRTADDFDVVDQVDRNLLVGGRAERRRAHLDAVDQHHHVIGVGAAHEQRRGLARSAVADDVDAGQAVQQLRQIARLQALDVLARDDGDGGERIVGFLRDAAGGDDDRLGVGRIGHRDFDGRSGLRVGRRGTGGNDGDECLAKRHEFLPVPAPHALADGLERRPREFDGQARAGNGHEPVPAAPTASLQRGSGPVSGLARFVDQRLPMRIAQWRRADDDALTVAGAAPALSCRSRRTGFPFNRLA